MKRLFIMTALTLFCLAFAATAGATSSKWHIGDYATGTHYNVFINGEKIKNLDHKLYTAKDPQSKRVYDAFTLLPSDDADGFYKSSLVSADDYFKDSPQTLKDITRYFQISHLVQDKSGKPNIELPLYAKYLQLAVMEIVTDGMANFNLFDGNFKLDVKDSEVQGDMAWLSATANHYSSLFYGADYFEHQYSFMVLVSDNNVPMLLVNGYEFKPSAVPVPGAVWLMGSGLAGLLALRRRSA